MRILKPLTKAIIPTCLAIGMLIAPSAQAYEQDTHLRMTYVLLRSMGVKDEVAKYLAVSNQQIDEEIATSSMLLSSQRKLNHFQGDYSDITPPAEGIIGWIKKKWNGQITIATRNHPMAHFRIWLGMKTGNLQLVGMGMHQLWDAYGHVGFNAALGHVEFGHDPDDPAREPSKYKDAIRSQIRTMVRVVDLMPEEWMDRKAALKFLNSPEAKAVLGRELTQADLMNDAVIPEALMANPEFVNLYRTLGYNTAEYKEIALKEIYSNFINNGALNRELSFTDIVPEELLHNPDFTIDDVLTSVIITGVHGEFLKAKNGTPLFNIEKITGGSEQELRNRVAQDQKYYEQKLRLYKSKEQILMSLGAQADQNPRNVSAREKYLHYKADLESDLASLMSGNIEEQSIEDMIASDEAIQKRAQQIAEFKAANDIAFQLTKDIIPHQHTEYYKTSWEFDTVNRQYFVLFKDEMFRHFIVKNFNSNWIMDSSKKSLDSAFKDGIDAFEMKLGVIPHDEWLTLARSSDYLSIVVDKTITERELHSGSTRTEALPVKYDFKNKLSFNIIAIKELLKVGVFGFDTLMKKFFIEPAKMFARFYQSQSIEEFRTQTTDNYKSLDRNSAANALIKQFAAQNAASIVRCNAILVK